MLDGQRVEGDHDATGWWARPCGVVGYQTGLEANAARTCRWEARSARSGLRRLPRSAAGPRADRTLSTARGGTASRPASGRWSSPRSSRVSAPGPARSTTSSRTSTCRSGSTATPSRRPRSPAGSAQSWRCSSAGSSAASGASGTTAAQTPRSPTRGARPSAPIIGTATGSRTRDDQWRRDDARRRPCTLRRRDDRDTTTTAAAPAPAAHDRTRDSNPGRLRPAHRSAPRPAAAPRA